MSEALDIIEKTGERMHQAELYRLKGALMLRSEALRSRPPAPDGQAAIEAETCFHRAIEVARRQSAKSLELRALVSLRRLRQAQGRAEEAHAQLAEVYGWFTEGFDTKDLQEARALLPSLS